MPNRTLIAIQLLVLALLALPSALLAQTPPAAEEWNTPAAAGLPQDLEGFLGSLAAQPLPGGESFIPAPESKVVYCGYQSCPTGQSCWYCNRNWVCIYNSSQPPTGCTGGSQ